MCIKKHPLFGGNRFTGCASASLGHTRNMVDFCLTINPTPCRGVIVHYIRIMPKDYDIFEVFDIEAKPAQELASEHLVSLRLAITINLGLKDKPVTEQIAIYKTLYDEFLREYNATNIDNVIEYCKSGLPHLHATVKVSVSSKMYYEYSNEEILRMFAKTIFIKLPKRFYRQFGKAKINDYHRIFETPAVYIKMPSVLSEGWAVYCKKTRVQN